MTDRDDGTRRMLAGLLAEGRRVSFDSLPSRVREHASAAGLSQVAIYLGDLQRRTLHLMREEAHGGPMPGRPGRAVELPIEDTDAGRAYQYGQIVSAGDGGDGPDEFWVPLLDTNERLGVVHIASAVDDERARADMFSLACLVAMLITGRRVTSDSYERVTRVRPMNVAAEMQWQLLPPRTYADHRIVIGAAMEPAYQTGGDAYDYAVTGDGVHLAIFDAMGHDTSAGFTANLAVNACRNQRRQSVDLVAMGENTDLVLNRQFGPSRYVTGILAHLNTTTGVFTWTNRGHHPPVLIREGQQVRQLDCPPAHPMGTDLGLPVEVRHEQLQPGDRILLYTDGVTEARRPGSQEFGLRRFTDFLIRHDADGLPVPETLRRLVRAVLLHHNDRLQDDATILLCEWLGPR